MFQRDPIKHMNGTNHPVGTFIQACHPRHGKYAEPTICVSSIVPIQATCSKFLCWVPKFASTSVHLLAGILRSRAVFERAASRVFGASRRLPFSLSNSHAVLTVLQRAYLGLLILLCSCAPKQATGPTDSFREISAPMSLHDDLSLDGLRDAITAQERVLQSKSSEPLIIGPVQITRGAYAAALAKLSEVLAQAIPTTSKLEYIRDNFRFFEFAGGDTPGSILLTGYFEPILRASLRPTAQLTQPLYRKPHDLVTISLNSFSERFKDERPLKGRVAGPRVVPYYSRAEIDGKNALAAKGLELAWVDPVDAFFLHIQGSGTLVLPDGEERHVVYSDKNGHRYEAIGKFLKARIAPKPITMPRVEHALRSMPPEERNTFLFQNPSYVFFNTSERRAITSLGIPATPGRTIAVDPRFAPKGALAYLTFQKPTFADTQKCGEDPASFDWTSRLVLDQDSGGAITGTGRVDLFWGRGDEAKRYAGVMQQPARIVYLAPRDPR